jgi:hypothetical protein
MPASVNLLLSTSSFSSLVVFIQQGGARACERAPEGYQIITGRATALGPEVSVRSQPGAACTRTRLSGRPLPAACHNVMVFTAMRLGGGLRQRSAQRVRSWPVRGVQPFYRSICKGHSVTLMILMSFYVRSKKKIQGRDVQKVFYLLTKSAHAKSRRVIPYKLR